MSAAFDPLVCEFAQELAGVDVQRGMNLDVVRAWGRRFRAEPAERQESLAQELMVFAKNLGQSMGEHATVLIRSVGHLLSEILPGLPSTRQLKRRADRRGRDCQRFLATDATQTSAAENSDVAVSLVQFMLSGKKIDL